MTVVTLTFVCARLAEHSDGKERRWTTPAALRVVDIETQETAPNVLASDANCPECRQIGAADYTASSVYVLPEDESTRVQAKQIRKAIREASA